MRVNNMGWNLQRSYVIELWVGGFKEDSRRREGTIARSSVQSLQRVKGCDGRQLHRLKDSGLDRHGLKPSSVIYRQCNMW